MKKKIAVFLDRDGTILDERGYLGDPKKMRFYPSSFRALKRLQKLRLALVVVTNQSGVGRGYFSLAQMKKVFHVFRKKLLTKGIRLSGTYICPHAPNQGCACRKPKTRLVKRAARDLGLDLKNSFMVGDQARDVALGRRMGGKGILVLTGAGRKSRALVKKSAAKIAKNLDSASQWIEKTVVGSA